MLPRICFQFQLEKLVKEHKNQCHSMQYLRVRHRCNNKVLNNNVICITNAEIRYNHTQNSARIRPEDGHFKNFRFLAKYENRNKSSSFVGLKFLYCFIHRFCLNQDLY